MTDPYIDAPHESFDFNLANPGFLTHSYQEEIGGPIKIELTSLKKLDKDND